MGFWDEYEKATQQESGGGGVLCQVVIEVGFKVYVSGLLQEDTWFAVVTSDDEARAIAKEEADDLAAQHGVERGGQWGIQIRAFKKDALVRGEPVSWKNDRFFNVQGWTSAAKEIVVPALQELGLILPWNGWATLGFAPDPYWAAQGHAEDKDADGNYVKSRIAYPTRIFANHDEALESLFGKINSGPAADIPFDNEPEAPEGYEVADWEGCIPSIKAMAGTADVPVLAQRFGVAEDWIEKALSA